MPDSTVYLTGAGPGDFKLVTVGALELIKKADCIIYDYLVNPRLLEFAGKDCKLIYVGKGGGGRAHTLSQEGINRLLVKEASAHKIVVRLKGGDPFIFGRGAEEALYLKKKRINFEIIPGVSSAIAVPAYAGIPLTVRSKNSTVGFITGHEDPTKNKSSINWSALVDALGTMVFLMGVGNLGSIVKNLVNCGKPEKTPVGIIMWGTTTAQRTVVGDLGNIVKLAKKNKINPPAIIIIGEVAGLRSELAWFEKRPLLGRRVLVTRTRSQAMSLSEKLIELGAVVIEVPAIKIRSLRADVYIKKEFLGNKYDWVFFTSQNGVEEFSRILRKINKDSRILAGSKICAIGSETANALKRIGINADLVPLRFCAEGVLERFKGKSLTGQKTLILRSKAARNVLPEGLKQLGADVKNIDLYDILPQKENATILKKVLRKGYSEPRSGDGTHKIDLVTFTSSSIVENFVSLLGPDYKRLLKSVKLASIGPITSGTIRKLGLRVDEEAKVYTIDGLVEAILKL